MSDTKSKLEQDLLILAMTVVPKIEYLDLKERHERVSQMLEIAEKALEKISCWGVDPTSTATAAVSEKALDQIKGLKK